jgi:hypothetical protein
MENMATSQLVLLQLGLASVPNKIFCFYKDDNQLDHGRHGHLVT